MVNYSLLISILVVHLQIFSVLTFEAISNQYQNTNGGNLRDIGEEPISCAGNDFISSLCGRCVGFMQSVSVTRCCESLDVQHQCLGLLNQVDDVEELLPAGLDVADEVESEVGDQKSGPGGVSLLHRALANSANQEGNRLDSLGDPGSAPSGLDLLLEDPHSYDAISKRAGLSGKYNRVWWRGPNKRPNDNRVFKNFNRIWWRNDQRS